MGDFVPRLQGRAFGEAMVSGHAVRAPFVGVKCHNVSYRTKRLIKRFHDAGLDAVIAPEAQSPIITAFGYPTPDFDFASFYEDLKQEGFVIYPGKVSEVDTFRIGTIGEVYPDDVDRLADAVVAHRRW